MASAGLNHVGKCETIMKALNRLGMGGRLVVIGVSPQTEQVYPCKTLIGKELTLLGFNDNLGKLCGCLRWLLLKKKI